MSGLRQLAPKVVSKQIAKFFMEISAKQATDLLKDFGIRARYNQRSRHIDVEPFVEHTYVVIVDYVHIDEFQCAKRILKSK